MEKNPFLTQDKTEIILCSCQSDEHQIIVHHDVDDKMVFLHIHLAKKNPLTDDRLAKILQEKGYHIARRTVAKYRIISISSDS